MKLWLDDVRHPPKGWIWARNVRTAKNLLRTGAISEASLDHDLGGTMLEAPNKILLSEDHITDYDGLTGTDLARWMAETGNIPEKIRIHSHNPAGAARMASYLPNARLQPFSGDEIPQFS